MNPQGLLIACKYAQGSSYAAEARELCASAARFGYPVRTFEVPDQGDWWRNCANKPAYLLEALREHAGPLLCLDADCRVLEPLDPLIAELDDCEMLVKHRPECCFTARFNAAVLMVRRTPGTLAILQTWAEHGQRYGSLHRFVEQGAFAEGVLFQQRHVRVRQLPERYHTMHEVDSGPPPPGTAIVHLKQSRKERQSALPPLARVVPDPWHERVSYAVLTPQPEPLRTMLPIDGVPGAVADFHEYATRYGIAHTVAAKVSCGPHEREEIERIRPQVIRQLCDHFPPGQRVVLCDHNTLFIREPRMLVEALDHADLVVAWDRTAGDTPATAALAFRAGPAISQVLLPAWEAHRAALDRTSPSEQSTMRALSETLRRTTTGLAVEYLSGRLVADLASATPETAVLVVRQQHRVHDLVAPVSTGSSCAVLQPAPFG